MGRQWLTALLLGACVGVVACDTPGACTESVVQQSVRYGWCKEVEHAGECPIFESSEKSDEFKWEFFANKKCNDEKVHSGLFKFKCGGGIFEDIESECLQGNTEE